MQRSLTLFRNHALRFAGYGYLAGNLVLLLAGAADMNPLQTVSAVLFIWSGVSMARERFARGCGFAWVGMVCLLATLESNPARWVTSALYLTGMGLGAAEDLVRPRCPAALRPWLRPSVAVGAGLSRLPMMAAALASAQPMVAGVATCWLAADLCIAASRPATEPVAA
jgi:hypothetical protein